MFKNFLAIAAVVFLVSAVSNPVYASVSEETTPTQKIKTIGTGKQPPKRSADEYIPEMRENARQTRALRQSREDALFSPEQQRLRKSKSHKWDVVKSPSFCSGYAKVKMEQHNNQYYQDMITFYDSRISDTDMMSGTVDREEFLAGYDMIDDNKIMECVEVYEKYRGFDE